MGLEPMTSPLPRECSTTELHQPFRPTLTSYREPSRASTTRKAKNPSSTQVSDRSFPGSIVRQASAANAAKAASAIQMRPLPPGLRSTCSPTPAAFREEDGAQGRIRTSVAHNAADLQSAAINHSATCASPASRSEHAARTRLQTPSPIPVANREGNRPEGVV